ncbi:MAG: aldose 1-epimerase family protein, partial [Turicibacter sp.]
MIKIFNDKLVVSINKLGAEIKSIYHIDNELEYMWNSNPEFWGKSSPTLFPIVGRLAQDQFLHDGVVYDLGQHGFARELPFEVIEQSESKVVFALVA